MDGNVKIKAYQNWSQGNIVLTFGLFNWVTGDYVGKLAKPLEFVKDEFDCKSEFEPVKLNHLAAQELMDSLYAAGVRPSDSGNTKDISAHLSDMRSIAFGLLKKEGLNVEENPGPTL